MRNSRSKCMNIIVLVEEEVLKTKKINDVISDPLVKHGHAKDAVSSM